MRHFLLPGAISTHAAGMRETPATAILIAPTSLPYRSTADQLRTRSGTVNLATVAVAANEYLRAAASAQKESARRFHRLAPHRADQISTGSGDLWNNLPAHVFGTLWGTASGKLGGLPTVSCLFCSAPSFLPHVVPCCHPLRSGSFKSRG